MRGRHNVTAALQEYSLNQVAKIAHCHVHTFDANAHHRTLRYQQSSSIVV